MAVARGRAVGVDLEAERPLRDLAGMARASFSPAERRGLEGLAEDARVGRFFRIWTAKEAYLKATGEGFQRPLDSFDVAVAGPGEPRLERVEGRPHEPTRWRFHRLDPGPGWTAAVAVEEPAGALHRWRAEPLLG